ncbi:MAG: carbon-nitrogen hydrolase family protein [Steroidobacteraceae bacterium]
MHGMTARQSVRVSVVQNAPRLGDVDGNLAACVAYLDRAPAAESDLVVFPECALSGDMLSDEHSARECADRIPGQLTAVLGAACERTGLHCVVGMLETEGSALYNTAVLIGPEGVIGRYRKSHIACIGVDCFTAPGNEPYKVFDTPVGRIGLQICYDWRFPEITRVLALQGAEMIIHPTNSPIQAREIAEYITRARAAENAVFFVTANRCGNEMGTAFFGWSQIVDPRGRRVVEAGAEETVLTADLDLELARDKVIEPQRGGYNVRLFEHRRPELYSRLVKSDS